MSSVIFPSDVEGIVSGYIQSIDNFIYVNKEKLFSTTDSQFYQKLFSLKQKYPDVTIPTENEYLSEKKESKLSSVDFFIKKYTQLGGVTAYSYNLIKIEQCLYRCSEDNKSELLQYYLKILQNISPEPV